MPSNIKKLQKDVKNFVTGKGRFKGDSPLAAVRQKIAAVILQNLAKTTPIDTGKLIGSWKLGVGRKPTGVGSGSKSRAISPDNATKIDKITARNRVYITNNRRYASFVEFGTSKMAPRSFTINALQASRLELRALGVKVNFNVTNSV